MHVTWPRSPRRTATSASCPGIAPISWISSASCRRSTPAWHLPYWRFDRPAPNVFTASSWGCRTPPASSSSPPGIRSARGARTERSGSPERRRSHRERPPRSAHRDTDDQPRRPGAERRPTQISTTMEGNPHGSAHVSFTGFISVVTDGRAGSAVLHAPLQRRSPLGQVAVDSQAHEPGRPARFRCSRRRTASGIELADTMWPWNGVTGAPRPPTAPGGTFPASIRRRRPASTPNVGAMIDYQAVGGGAPLGFAYDDVPFDCGAGGDDAMDVEGIPQALRSRAGQGRARKAPTRRQARRRAKGGRQPRARTPSPRPPSTRRDLAERVAELLATLRDRKEPLSRAHGRAAGARRSRLPRPALRAVPRRLQAGAP